MSSLIILAVILGGFYIRLRKTTYVTDLKAKLDKCMEPQLSKKLNYGMMTRPSTDKMKDPTSYSPTAEMQKVLDKLARLGVQAWRVHVNWILSDTSGLNKYTTLETDLHLIDRTIIIYESGLIYSKKKSDTGTGHQIDIDECKNLFEREIKLKTFK